MSSVSTDLREQRSEQRWKDRRSQRSRMRRGVRQLLAGTWVGRCGQVVGHWGKEQVEGSNRVSVRKAGEAGVCHLTGRMLCGSVWACPVCAAKIRQSRADEIRAASVEAFKRGWALYFVTLTFPHDWGMPLDELFGVVPEGWRSLLQGRAWHGPSKAERLRLAVSGRQWREGIKQRLGIKGHVRAVEVTHGQHGWHPHAHGLFFMERALDTEQMAEFEAYITERWGKFVRSRGLRDPSAQYGVDIRPLLEAKDIGAYLTKIGGELVMTGGGDRVDLELTRPDLKQPKNGNVTPWQVLGDFLETGEVAMSETFKDYYAGTKGRRFLTWSKGLRAELGLGDEETDEDLANEEVGGEDQIHLHSDLWYELLRVASTGTFNEHADVELGLVEACERGGPTAVMDYVASLGVPFRVGTAEDGVPMLYLVGDRVRQRGRHVGQRGGQAVRQRGRAS